MERLTLKTYVVEEDIDEKAADEYRIDLPFSIRRAVLVLGVKKRITLWDEFVKI